MSAGFNPIFLLAVDGAGHCFVVSAGGMTYNTNPDRAWTTPYDLRLGVQDLLGGPDTTNHCPSAAPPSRVNTTDMEDDAVEPRNTPRTQSLTESSAPGTDTDRSEGMSCGRIEMRTGTVARPGAHARTPSRSKANLDGLKEKAPTQRVKSGASRSYSSGWFV